jgi:hypothetical protein
MMDDLWKLPKTSKSLSPVTIACASPGETKPSTIRSLGSRHVLGSSFSVLTSSTFCRRNFMYSAATRGGTLILVLSLSSTSARIPSPVSRLCRSRQRSTMASYQFGDFARHLLARSISRGENVDRHLFSLLRFGRWHRSKIVQRSVEYYCAAGQKHTNVDCLEESFKPRIELPLPRHRRQENRRPPGTTSTGHAMAPWWFPTTSSPSSAVLWRNCKTARFAALPQSMGPHRSD